MRYRIENLLLHGDHLAGTAKRATTPSGSGQHTSITNSNSSGSAAISELHAKECATGSRTCWYTATPRGHGDTSDSAGVARNGALQPSTEGHLRNHCAAAKTLG